MHLNKAGQNFWAKIKQYPLTLANILSYFSLKLPSLWQIPYSTYCLYLKAKLLGIELGQNIRAYGQVGLLRWPGSIISIGANSQIISSWRRSSAAPCWPTRLRTFSQKAKIQIGAKCELNGTSISARSTSIILGESVLLGPNVCIVDSDFHAPLPIENRANNPGFERDSAVLIDDFVWVGMNSTILKGSKIGKGAIIGANSLICGNIPPYHVVAGNPAKILYCLKSD